MAHKDYFVNDMGTRVIRGLNDSNLKRNRVKYNSVIIPWAMQDEFSATVSQSMCEAPRTTQRIFHPEKKIPAHIHLLAFMCDYIRVNHMKCLFYQLK